MKTPTKEPTERPQYRQRVVFAEKPEVAAALEERAVEHGRSVAAEVRSAVREHLRRESNRERRGAVPHGAP